jgi:hypothetical protein
MFIIDGIIVHPEVFSAQFICHLTKCKGACCWEGDFGAPVTDDEITAMENNYKFIEPLLSEGSKSIVQEKGVALYDSLYKDTVTPLHEDGACAYLVKNKDGIAQCAWELAHKTSESTFVKPISCHLYPIRVKNDQQLDMEQLTYDQWDICSAACQLGIAQNTPVFRFLKEPIIRKYGDEFYVQMENIYQRFFSDN